jgi:transposase-like protein
MLQEWKECKKCRSTKLVKNGKQDGVQRYKCMDCGSVFRGKDRQYSAEFKMEAIMMYINSMGIRAIARVKKVHNSVISVWIKQIGKVAKDVFSEKIKEIEPKDISIMEVDELFTYVKKKRIKRIYLLLLTETGSKLLDLFPNSLRQIKRKHAL